MDGRSVPRGNARFPVVFPAVVALVATLLGGAAAFAGSLASSEREYQQQREQRLLEQRETYYSAFLEDSNTYANAANAVQAFIDAGHSRDELTDQRTLLSDFRDARYAFRGDINSVMVFGTSAIGERARALVATLPPTQREGSFSFDYARYNASYRDFLGQFCREAQTDSANCEGW